MVFKCEVDKVLASTQMAAVWLSFRKETVYETCQNIECQVRNIVKYIEMRNEKRDSDKKKKERREETFKIMSREI